MAALQVLDQADACALVFDQDQVHTLALLALAEHNLILFLNFGTQVWVLQAILPAVDEHD